MPEKEKQQYHYIYRTTCTVTGKYYWGRHSTYNLNDGYMGSGTILKRSINKHGKENHVCEILEHYFTREWLREREAELICAEILNDPLCMNLELGGFGDFHYVRMSPKYNEWTKQGRQKTDEILLAKGLTNKDLAKLAAAHCKIHKKGAAYDPAIKVKYNFANNKTNQQLGNSPTARAKAAVSISKTAAKNGNSKGSKNSQYGTCWIYSLTEMCSKKIEKHELAKYLANGWQAGRKMHF